MGSGFSQTQAQIGTGMADVEAGLSGYIRIFLFIIAAVFAIVAFVPMSIGMPSSNAPCGTTVCLVPGDVYQDGKCLPSGNLPITQTCLNPQETCQNQKCTQGTQAKKTHPMFLIGTAVFILLGLVVVPISKKMQQISHSSPGAAQAVGLLGEANILEDILGRR
jgi:hypothetical protein